MRYTEAVPHPPLDTSVECFWFLEDGPAALPRPLERIVPDGCTELILHLGDRFERLTASGADQQPGAFLVGQLPHFVLLRPSRTIDTVGVRFRPAGARRFFRGPASSLTGRFVALDDLWGRRATDELQDRLRAATRQERVGVLERALLGAMAGEEGDRAVARSAGFILGRSGRVRVADVARDAGVSERSLERRFQEQLGLAPKAFARIARLQGALKSVGRQEQPDWADVAAECSYFDQPHLIRDFRALTGETPGEFVKNQGRLSLSFTDPRRLAALLGG